MVRIVLLDDSGSDCRGQSSSFALSDLAADLAGAFGPAFQLRDAHVMTLRPGCVRGNHYHALHREILLVLPGPEWSLWWDAGESTPVSVARFDGSQAVAVLVAPGSSHAVRNDGRGDMRLVGLSDRRYDPLDPDAHPRKVVESR